MDNRRKRWIRCSIYTLLVMLSVVCFFPFFWLIRSSFMSSEEIFAIPMRILPVEIRYKNFYDALTYFDFLTCLKNTIIIVFLNMIGNILSASFAAFGFSRIRFKGRSFFFGVVISTLMMPHSVILIPQFFGWFKLGLYNTFGPLFIPSFFINAFFIFLIRQFYMTIPNDYDEAAFMDGANYLYIYAKILLPLSKPVLTTVGVFTFMWTWNDFFGPLIYLKSAGKFTLALGLTSFLSRYINEWHYLMAASTVVIIPMIILFFFAQRYFIEGITFTGIKA